MIPIDRAERKVMYKCIECGDDVFPRKGEIRLHHFAHLTKERVCIKKTLASNEWMLKLLESVSRDLYELHPTVSNTIVLNN